MEQLDRKGKVKEFFEQPQVYLTYDYNLKIRTETVRSMMKGREMKTVLDAPCGTGDISIPLLDRIEQLTCVDFSENMIKHCKGTVPEDRKDDVQFVHGDILKWESKETYGVVICLGLLAHADDPEKMLTHLMQKVEQGGYLVLQNTDGSHPYSLVCNFSAATSSICTSAYEADADIDAL